MTRSGRDRVRRRGPEDRERSPNVVKGRKVGPSPSYSGTGHSVDGDVPVLGSKGQRDLGVLSSDRFSPSRSGETEERRPSNFDKLRSFRGQTKPPFAVNRSFPGTGVVHKVVLRSLVLMCGRGVPNFSSEVPPKRVHIKSFVPSTFDV